MKKCKRCNGTGKVLKDKKGDSAVVKHGVITFTTGKHTNVKGVPCPRCGGRGEK